VTVEPMHEAPPPSPHAPWGNSHAPSAVHAVAPHVLSVVLHAPLQQKPPRHCPDLHSSFVLQAPVPRGTTHAPLTHTAVALASAVEHAVPHAPQLFESVCSSTQVPLQSV
jgi:hypothetical protein